MGCAPSAPELADTLPIKAQFRTAFSRTSTADRPPYSRQPTDKQLGQQPNTEAHDVVLCYALAGTIFGLELQARYEKLDSLSLWSPEHLVSAPGTPAMSMALQDCASPRPPRPAPPGLEIKPVPESSEAPSCLPTPAQLLSREVQVCRRGVVVLLTAGCTWDDGVLSCLRLAGKFLRPLVMVHCIQSCPLPALEEWPPDVRSIIAAAGPPVKYLSQHSTEALHEVETRMVTAAAAAGLKGTKETSATTRACASTQPPQPPVPKARQPQQPPAAVVPGAVNCPCANDTPPAATAPPRPNPAAGPGPLSLAALHASDGAISRRAAQLLQSWPCILGRESSGSSSAACGGTGITTSGTSRTESVVTTTLVEPLMMPQRSSKGLTPQQGPQPHHHHQEQLLGVEGVGTAEGSSGTPATTSPGNSFAPCSNRSGTGARARGCTSARISDRSAVGGKSGSSSGRSRCVLRYLDAAAWATPVAFVCAQLEQEIGPANVSLQPGAHGAAGCLLPPARGGTAAAGCASGGDSGGSGGGLSLNLHDWTQAQNRQGQGGSLGYHSGTAATVAAELQIASRSGGCDRMSASDGSGGHPPGLFDMVSTGTTASGTDGMTVTIVGSSCGLQRTVIGCEEDDLATYTSAATAISLEELQKQQRQRQRLMPKPPGCGSGSSSTSSGATHPPNACGASAATPRSAPRRVSAGQQVTGPGARTPASWTGGELELERQGERLGVAGGDTGAVLVYFVTPGVSAPGSCLIGVTAGLAAGRRVVLVVDGESCQRLPIVAPGDVTAEAWKVLKKLWNERILYVADYHTSFCALLKQRIVPSAAAVMEPRSQ